MLAVSVLRNKRVYSFCNRNRYVSTHLQDLLTEKIKSGRHPLESYFPEFANYQLPADASYEASDDPEVVRAKYYIRGEFLVSHHKIKFSCI